MTILIYFYKNNMDICKVLTEKLLIMWQVLKFELETNKTYKILIKIGF